MNECNRTEGGVRRFIAGLILVGALGVAAGMVGALMSPIEGVAATLVTFAAIGGTLLAGVGVGLWWWSRLDEAAREAHKWAWWWGGSAGLMVAALGLLTVMLRGGAADADMADGMTVVLLCQVLGYGVAWAFWWLRRR